MPVLKSKRPGLRDYLVFLVNRLDACEDRLSVTFAE